VRARLDQLMITPAFGARWMACPKAARWPGQPRCRTARPLLAAMERRPVDYCGQEIVTLHHARADRRCLRAARLHRARLCRAQRGKAMDRDARRLCPPSSSGEMVTTMMGEGDISADVCVVDPKADRGQPGCATPSVLGAAPAVRRGGGILASQAADNLFWFGRYVERAETTVRVIRAVLGSSIEVDAAAGHNPEVIARLVDLMVSWGALSRDQAARPIAQACHAALSDTAMNGSVGALIAAIRATALTLRDRFTTDFWRIASRPLPAMDGHRPGVCCAPRAN
jgi:hypothetical protein